MRAHRRGRVRHRNLVERGRRMTRYRGSWDRWWGLDPYTPFGYFNLGRSIGFGWHRFVDGVVERGSLIRDQSGYRPMDSL